MSGSTKRRDFLKQMSVAGVGFWVGGGSVLGQEERQKKSPNEKLNIAVIGCGGKGYSDMRSVESETIYALCDVDDRQADRARKEHPNTPYYKDYRELLEKDGKHLDGVIVATPDHSHAPASVMAMKMGIGVYCQKPLTHTVYEARVMRETATKYKVATQMGNQGTANKGLRRAAEIVQAGGIGEVREVHVWTNRPIWDQGMKRPEEKHEIPKGLDWDLWLGPAAERPYNNAYLPFSWRGWWDFGTGALGDMACHTMNLPFFALKLGYPTRVESVTTPFNRDSFPMASHIKFEFPARDDMPALTLHWYDGGLKPFSDLLYGANVANSGSLLVGSKGRLYSPGDYGDTVRLLPEKDFEGYEGPSESIPRSPGHYREWLDAIRGGPKAMSNFDYAALLTESILLGNVAMAVGGPIEYDGPNMKVTNNKKANDYLHTEYRKGWTL